MFTSLLSWIFNLIVDAIGTVVNHVLNMILDEMVFNVDNGVLTVFPRLKTLYATMRNIALGLAVLIFLYSMTKFLIAPLSEVSDSPLNLALRFVASVALIIGGNNLLVAGINLVYSGFSALKIDAVNNTSALIDGTNILNGIKASFSTPAVGAGVNDAIGAAGAVAGAVTGANTAVIAAGPLLLIGLLFFIAMEYYIIKLIISCVYHWVHLIIIVYTSPLPFATFTSTSTKPVFDKWISMYIGECFAFLLSVWGLLVTEGIFTSDSTGFLIQRFIWGSVFAKVILGIDNWIRQLGIGSISIPHGPGALSSIADKAMRLTRHAQMAQRVWDGQTGIRPLDNFTNKAKDSAAALTGTKMDDNKNPSVPTPKTKENRNIVDQQNREKAMQNGIPNPNGHGTIKGDTAAKKAVEQGRKGAAEQFAQKHAGAHPALANIEEAANRNGLALEQVTDSKGRPVGFKFSGNGNKESMAANLSDMKKQFDPNDASAQKYFDMASKALSEDKDVDAKNLLAETKNFARDENGNLLRDENGKLKMETNPDYQAGRITDSELKKAVAEGIAKEDSAMKPSEQVMDHSGDYQRVTDATGQAAFDKAAASANANRNSAGIQKNDAESVGSMMKGLSGVTSEEQRGEILNGTAKASEIIGARYNDEAKASIEQARGSIDKVNEGAENIRSVGGNELADKFLKGEQTATEAYAGATSNAMGGKVSQESVAAVIGGQMDGRSAVEASNLSYSECKEASRGLMKSDDHEQAYSVIENEAAAFADRLGSKIDLEQSKDSLRDGIMTDYSIDREAATRVVDGISQLKDEVPSSVMNNQEVASKVDDYQAKVDKNHADLADWEKTNGQDSDVLNFLQDSGFHLSSAADRAVVEQEAEYYYKSQSAANQLGGVLDDYASRIHDFASDYDAASQRVNEVASAIAASRGDDDIATARDDALNMDRYVTQAKVLDQTLDDMGADAREKYANLREQVQTSFGLRDEDSIGAFIGGENIEDQIQYEQAKAAVETRIREEGDHHDHFMADLWSNPDIRGASDVVDGQVDILQYDGNGDRHFYHAECGEDGRITLSEAVRGEDNHIYVDPNGKSVDLGEAGNLSEDYQGNSVEYNSPFGSYSSSHSSMPRSRNTRPSNKDKYDVLEESLIDDGY